MAPQNPNIFENVFENMDKVDEEKKEKIRKETKGEKEIKIKKGGKQISPENKLMTESKRTLKNSHFKSKSTEFQKESS